MEIVQLTTRVDSKIEFDTLDLPITHKFHSREYEKSAPLEFGKK